MISVNNLSRYYNQLPAVNGVSFEVSKGEIIGLLGHNGAGKSTIMKMLSGYLDPSEGTILIDNQDVVNNRQQVQKAVGYLPENLPIYGEMKVIDYLHYMGCLRSLDSQQLQQQLQQAIENTDLMDRIDHRIETLSRGYKQRVAVAGTIIGNPKVLILDEPTNGLDPTQTQLMRKLIKTISQHTTVILSTHIMQEVEALCDRVLIMNNGCLAQDTSLHDLHKTHTLLVTTNAKQTTWDTLKRSLTNIKQVKLLDACEQGYLYQLDLNPKIADTEVVNTSASINKQLIKEGFEVYQIQQQKRDLESIFNQLSQTN